MTLRGPLIASPQLFTAIYNERALALCTVALVATLIVGYARSWGGAAARAAVTPLLATLAISTAARLAFWHRNVIRTAYMMLNIDRFVDPTLVDLKYPVAYGALVWLTGLFHHPDGQPYGAAFGVLLVTGALTPPVLYLVAREITDDARLAFTAGLMAALHPVHIIFTGHYDFYPVSLFYDALLQLFLLRYMRTHRTIDLVAFALSSYLFCNSRVENNAVFYVNTVVLLIAARKATRHRAAQAVVIVAYLGAHLAVHFDWMHSHLMQQHMVQNLPFAPITFFRVVFTPKWNSLLDLRYSPPYLLLLVVVGVYAAARHGGLARRYEAAVFMSMLLLYVDITDSTVLWNARYFLNLLPSLVMVATCGLERLSARSPRVRQFAPWVVALCFLPYIPMLSRFAFAVQDEYTFYRDEVLPRLPRRATVWKLSLPDQVFQWELRDHHLFEIDGFHVINDAGDLRSGEFLFIGLNCYQMLDRPLPIRPECGAQLHDPNNVVVLRRRIAARPFHNRAPWYISGVWRRFQSIDLYVLRRR